MPSSVYRNTWAAEKSVARHAVRRSAYWAATKPSPPPTPYDLVIDVDNPISHWKLGASTIVAADRKGLTDLPAVNGPIATAAGLITGNDSNNANTFLAASTQRFAATDGTDRGIPYNTSETSVEAWVQIPGSPSITQQIVFRTTGLTLAILTSRFARVSVTDTGGVVRNIPSTFALDAGTPYHLAATFDGATLILYINGVENVQLLVTGRQSNTTSRPTIATSVGFDGILDEVAWYGTALSPARIQAHYVAGGGTLAPTYNDSGTGVITTSGTKTESASFADSRTGVVTASGTGVESYTATTPYDAVIDVDSPISHWKLGAATIAVDRKGVRDLTAVNGPITVFPGGLLGAGNGGQAASRFVRASSQVFQHSPGGGAGDPYNTANWSFECWFVMYSLLSGDPFARAFIAARLPQSIEIDSSGRLVALHTDASGSGITIVSPENPGIAQIRHVVATYDGATFRLYMNARLVVSMPRASTYDSNTHAPSIGAGVDGVNAFDGDIDEVAWYNTALSGARVQAHFLAGGGTIQDFAIGTITVSGTRVESRVADDARTGVVAVSGSAVESWSIATPYDLVIDADNPISHWKMGGATQALDRKAVAHLTAYRDSNPSAIGTGPGIVANNAADTANVFYVDPDIEADQFLERFIGGGTVGVGVPYDTSTWSIEAWINISGPFPWPDYYADFWARTQFLAIDNLGEAQADFYLYARDASLNFYEAHAVLPPSPGSVRHIVGVYDGTDLILYVDGVEGDRVPMPSTKTDPNDPPLIGSTSNPFSGLIDEVAVYGTALSPARVLAHWNAGKPSGDVYTDAATGTITASGTAIEAWGSGYAGVILSDLPNGYWRLADLTDSSGHGLTLTQTGTVTDEPSLIRYVNGAKRLQTNFFEDGFRRANESLLNSTEYAIEAWGKPAYVGEEYTPAQKDHQYALILKSSGVFSVMFYTSTGFYQASGTTVAVINETYHIVGTLEDEVASIYVNGVLEGTIAAPGTPVTNANAFCIGPDPGIANGWWGVVDEVALYSSALSPARVLAHYEAGAPLDIVAPVLSVDSVDATRISRVPGKDAVNVTFTAGEAFVEYEVRRVSSTADGRAMGSQVEMATVSARTSHSIVITDDELIAASAVEGTNLLKVFVKDAAGNWSD